MATTTHEERLKIINLVSIIRTAKALSCVNEHAHNWAKVREYEKEADQADAELKKLLGF